MKQRILLKEILIFIPLLIFITCKYVTNFIFGVTDPRSQILQYYGYHNSYLYKLKNPEYNNYNISL